MGACRAETAMPSAASNSSIPMAEHSNWCHPPFELVPPTDLVFLRLGRILEGRTIGISDQQSSGTRRGH